MTVQWHGEDVKKETAKLVATKIRQATFLVQGAAIDNCPVVTGRLKGSIDVEITDTKGIVYTNVDYAPHVELGTEPHIIRAVNKKVLSNGKQCFGKEVHHPGTTAQPFMRDALFKNEKNIEAIFRS